MSPFVLSAADCVLLLVDMQERLGPAIAQGDVSLDTARRLALAAGMLDVPVVATEHAPERIGPTCAELAGLPRRIVAKRHFDAMREPGFIEQLPPGRDTVLVAGWEAHVCVLQTALGLAAAGMRAVLVADACGSRRPADHHAALRRMRAHGVEIATAEMAMFEWLEHCDHPRFRDVLALVKQATAVSR